MMELQHLALRFSSSTQNSFPGTFINLRWSSEEHSPPLDVEIHLVATDRISRLVKIGEAKEMTLVKDKLNDIKVSYTLSQFREQWKKQQKQKSDRLRDYLFLEVVVTIYSYPSAAEWDRHQFLESERFNQTSLVNDSIPDMMWNLLFATQTKPPDSSILSFTFPKEPDVPKLHAHRAILAARCPYFQEMLEASGKTMQESVSGDVEVVDFTYATMKTFVLYLYTAIIDTPFPTIDQIQQLYLAARYYMMEPLVKLCELRLMADVNAQNYLSVLARANEMQLPFVKTNAMLHLKENVSVEFACQMVALPAMTNELWTDLKQVFAEKVAESKPA
jgi:hypothetical protein